MNLVSGIVVFIIIWWVVIFIILPFGVTKSDTPAPGHDTGAPRKSHIRIKILITTLITIILWCVINYIITKDIITL